MKKVLIVVDMQNDFTHGALRNEDAIAVIPRVEEKVRAALAAGQEVIFTADTHDADYPAGEEGKNLPVMHCMDGTEGWEIVKELAPYAEQSHLVKKTTFGSRTLGEMLAERSAETPVEEVELVGVCTDICVISNALLIKAFLPNAHIVVDAACCAGVTPESHRTALAAMRACHVEIVNGD